jgi:hypothetical protein
LAKESQNASKAASPGPGAINLTDFRLNLRHRYKAIFKMKIIILTIAACLMVQNATFAQNTPDFDDDKEELRKVLDTFMNSLKTKDSLSLYNLFYEGHVTWVGVYKGGTQQRRFEKDSNSLNYKIEDYKTWFRSTTNGASKEEKFYNVNIDTDGFIASVTFDFSFWAGGKKGLWGKESWGLVKINKQWKITSVIFSMEQENIVPEPKRE